MNYILIIQLFVYFIFNFTRYGYMEKIYLLKSDNGDEPLYKIGITNKNINERISQLQTGNGNPIHLVKFFESEFNRKIETALHYRYGHKRKSSEWFNLTSEEVDNFLTDCQVLHDNFEYLKSVSNPFI